MSYEIDWQEWQDRKKPFGISGCFRLRNESEFMEQAILSHLPYLDEAVLVVQPSDDGTQEIAERMAYENHKVSVFLYPYIPDWIATPGFYEKDPDRPGHLVHMSNWALSKCKYSWICKVEGDVICLSSFRKIVDAVKSDPSRQHYYGRVILNVAGENCDQISVTNPRNGGWDEAVFPNDPGRYHFVRSGKWEMVPTNGPATCLGWSGLHMKRCKAVHLPVWNGEQYAPYARGNVSEVLSAFNASNPYPGPDNPLGEECLFELQE
jgi:hypothetical protein